METKLMSRTVTLDCKTRAIQARKENLNVFSSKQATSDFVPYF